MSSFDNHDCNIDGFLITFKSFIDLVEDSLISLPVEILKETFIKRINNINKYLNDKKYVSKESEYNLLEDFLDVYGEFTSLIKNHEKVGHYAKILNISTSNCSKIIFIAQKLFFISIQEINLEYIINTYMSEKRYMIRFIMNIFRLSSDEKHPYYEIFNILVLEFQKDENFMRNLIEMIETIQKYTPPSYSLDEFNLTSWLRNVLKKQFELLKLVFISIYYKMPCTLEMAVSWFKLMKEFHYLLNKRKIYSINNEVNLLQRIVSLSLIISIEIIRPSRNLNFLNENLHDNTFYSSPDAFLEVHNMIVKLVEDPVWSPVIIAWGIILHELFIDITERQDFSKEYHSIQDQIFPNNSFESSKYLIEISLKYNVLSMIGNMISSFSPDEDLCIDTYRMVLRELFRKILNYVKFSDSVVNCFIKIHENISSDSNLAYLFWSDDIIVRLLHSARTRFPYDFFSMIRICRSVSSDSKSTYDFLKNIPTFTQITPVGFKGYDILEEDFNGTLVKLIDDLKIFSAKISDNSNDIIIPKYSLGRIISYDISPPVIMWDYCYSSWEFLGKILEISLTDRLFIKNEKIIIEIILIMTNILKSNDDLGKQLITDISSDLMDQSDIIGIVREICSLSLQLNEAPEFVRLNLISASIDFFSEVIRSSSKNWSHIFKLNLLDKNENSGLLYNIFSSEIVLANYSIQISFLKLLRVLLENYISITDCQHNFQAFQADYITRAFKYTYELFESFIEWRYTYLSQKYDIGLIITSLFLRILEFTYDLDYRYQNSPIMNSIKPLAQFILDKFLSQNSDSRCLHTLWKVFKDKHITNAYNQWVKKTINFIDCLIRIRNWMKSPLSALEKQLFQRLPSILSFMQFSKQYYIPILQLITNMISSSSQRLPSLLAYLSNYTSIFIENLKYIISNPIIDQNIKTHVWKFSSAVMKFQQGLAILLLTGNSSFQQNAQSKQENSNSSLFKLAILELYKINDVYSILNSEYLASFLEFIANAQNCWVSVVPLKFKDDKFWSKILTLIDWISTLKSNFSTNLSSICYQIAGIAFSVQICTAEIYLQSQTQSTILKSGFEKSLLNKLDSYSKFVLNISGYRVSLHSNLKKNFEKTYSDKSLFCFRNSGIIKSPSYGDEYFYNLHITNIILGNNKVSLAYLNEMKEANLNLSLLDAQVTLLRAWIFLCSSIFHPKSLEIENLKTYVNIIITALKANSKENIDLSIMMPIAHERAELSLFLTMHLQAIKSKFHLGSYFSTILLYAWEAISSSEANFLLSIGTKNSQYTRTLLRIIYICLHGINSSEDNVENHTMFPILIGLSDLVLARGASKLFSKALETQNSVFPSDIMLFAAIAEEIFDIQGIEALYDTITTSMFQHDNFHSIITFFSNIDTIKENQDNYLFAEASLLFLYTLSSIPSLSEQLVVYGLLNILVDASICHEVQEKVINIQNSNTGSISLSLYQLWVRGILPIVVNLLRHLGNRIFVEICGFLKIYDVQIQTAFENWNRPTVITSLVIEETFLLVMIFDILHMEGNNNNDYLFNKTELLDSITYLLSHPKYLATLIIPVTEMDHLMAAKLSDDNETVPSTKFINYISEKLEGLRNVL
ncbi:hypothetical protein PNEG_00068 [Pneumocystis murina B123]|uniref:Uncharacterized protein n=1 Tax=Pneumocystis murina (strain B123) TaxID=1069680 RepID=M7PMC7_PNEMU|nr:hypothetical protein PNEG_00068 [Pneumocystis murina B123]EMR11629.1 hypothetical protein PNEG_00068 [Pneumocystis murina B123]